MKEMKILIQNRRTQLFLKKDGTWDQSPAEAMEFPTPFTALNYSVEQKLGDTEVVFIPTHPLATAKLSSLTRSQTGTNKPSSRPAL